MPLPDLVCRYSYKPTLDNSPTFPNESKRLKAKGFLSLADLHKLAHWKSQRSAGRVKLNRDSDVRKFTRVALDLASRRNLPPSIPISVLTILEGIRVPTASVVLTVWDPRTFGIIDVNAWSALFNYSSARSTPFEAREYDYYTSILHELRRMTGLTAREIDIALWTWWDEKKEDRSHAR